MADIWAEVVEFTADTIGSGTTISLTTHSGDTPKAAMFYMVKATSANTLTADSSMGWGVADATNNGACAIANEDNLADSVCDRWENYGAMSFNQGSCIALIANGGGSLLYDARLSSFSTGTVSLSTITTAASGYKGICIAFGGSDLEAFCGKLDAPASGGTVTATPGFETTIAFFGGCDKPADDGFSVNSAFSLGVFCYNNPTITQSCMSGIGHDGQTSGVTCGAYHNAECYAAMNPSTINYVLACTSVTSTQFTLTQTQITGSDTSDDIIYLALGGTGATYTGVFTPSTSTGTAVGYTAIGFESELIGTFCSRQSLEATAGTVGDSWGGSTSIGVVDTTGTAVNLAYYDEDGAATTNCATRYSTDQLWHCLDDAQGTAQDWQCAFVSIDATGYTMDQSTAVGRNTHDFIEWAIELGSPASGTTGRTNPFIGRSPFRGAI